MAQSHSNVLLHLVFSTAGRVPCLADDWRDELHRYMAGLLRQRESHCQIVGSVNDHVHLLTSLPRTRSIADLVRELKAVSSQWLQSHVAVTPFHWQGGYGCFSVSASHVPQVARYIARQAEHHRVLSFEDELRGLLDRHGLEYDERFLWD